MSKYTVAVVYRDKNLDKIGEADYPLRDYVEKQRYGMTSMLIDIEDLIYKATGEREKEKWPEEYLEMFMKMRHKIFDIANSVSRIPDNLKCDGAYVYAIDATKAVANLIR